MGYWMGVLRSRGVSGVLGGVGGFSSWFAGRGVGGRVDKWLDGLGSRYAREGVSERLMLKGWADSEYVGRWWSRWVVKILGGVGGAVEILGE